MEKKYSMLRNFVDARAVMYLRFRELVEAADTLYRQAAILDDRLRLGEQVSEQDVELFVEQQAKNLIKTSANEISLMDSVKVLIEECGHEAVIKCLKIYEEEQRRAKAN